MIILILDVFLGYKIYDMAKKSITIDVEESMLKNMHKQAIDIDTSRKNFLEECINLIGEDPVLMERVKVYIKQKSPAK